VRGTGNTNLLSSERSQKPSQQYMFGIQIQRDRTARTLSISQREYIRKLLEHTSMSDCRPAPTPLETGTTLTKADCPHPPTPDADFVGISLQWEPSCTLCWEHDLISPSQ
jgi:hypothetical protein